ncbi:MAG: HAMP domain-containing histidine kinase [Ilumatobacter sp.]|nr:HAMP domain-containing histidine kinase [Ilumatobacter sp.]
MRLATRSGLAAFAAALVAAGVVSVAVQARFASVLEQQTDDELDERVATAPILAVVAERLAASELSVTVEGARVLRDGRSIGVGRLPDGPLPPVEQTGYATVEADGERWRLLSVPVADVPEVGDEAVVQLVAPLGDVDQRTAALRTQLALIGLGAALAAGLLGYFLGRRATRPLARLRADAEAIDHDDPTTWEVTASSGAPDVDDVAAALNGSLHQVAAASEQRAGALEAARSFAAGATHEVRTPLQSALTNLDIAAGAAGDDAARDAALGLAREQLQRAAAGLGAVRALADAEFADPAWFEAADLVDVVEAAVAAEVGRADVELSLTTDAEFADPGRCADPPIWTDGVELAVANIVRNAVRHGRPREGVHRIDVRVDGARVTVDDNGPGISESLRPRVLDRFERGTGSAGSGLGLAFAHQVAVAHGGRVTVNGSPTGGARVVLDLRAGDSSAPT